MTTPMDKFIEQMGLMFQAEGAPRIAGQILGYLLVEGEPRTLAQMTEALMISKASASTNARLLEFKGSVRRVARMGSRQDAWEVTEESNLQMLVAMAERFRASARAFASLAAEFPADHAGARGRVERFADFHLKSAQFIEEWTHRLTGEAGAAPLAPVQEEE